MHYDLYIWEEFKCCFAYRIFTTAFIASEVNAPTTAASDGNWISMTIRMNTIALSKDRSGKGFGPICPVPRNHPRAKASAFACRSTDGVLFSTQKISATSAWSSDPTRCAGSARTIRAILLSGETLSRKVLRCPARKPVGFFS